MPTHASIVPAYNRYGRNGWNVIAKGMSVMWFATKKLAKNFIESKGMNVL